MIIASGQGITPKQLEENSVIRRAESHKINSTFKVPTYFQNASGGAYISVSWDSNHYEDAYIDGKNVYSVDDISNSGDIRKKAISNVPQLIKTQKIKILPIKIDDVNKLIIKSFSFTSTPPLEYYYYDTDRNNWYLYSVVDSDSPSFSICNYSRKFDDILNCTLPDNLTIEKDGIYLTEHYVCIKEYYRDAPVDDPKKNKSLGSSEELTAIKNGTFEFPFTCDFEISFIEFK